MPWSTFVTFMLANEKHIPARDWYAIRELGKARLMNRMDASRADSALDFSDLIERAEKLIGPR
jgi:hypothetical protein